MKLRLQSLANGLCRLAVLLLCMSMGLSVFAQSQKTEQPLPVDRALGIITLPLWPAATGADVAATGRSTSTLTVFLPQPGKGNGTAVIIAPGGAYISLASNLEGRQVADWFAARGVTAFVLKYRFGPRHPFPQPLLDAQRAIRLVRSMSKEFNLSQNRIGFAGFSAGGHLAAVAGTSFQGSNPAGTDPVERLSDRPNFLVLGYPWLNAMQPNTRHLITYCSVMPSMPPEKCKEWQRQYTPVLHVTSETPSTFIYGTSDDKTVSVPAIVDFYQALIAAGVPVEMHLFRHGAHGSGLGSGDEALDMWPVLLENWLRGQGLLTPEPAIAAAEVDAVGAPPRKPGQPLTIDSRLGDIMSDPGAVGIIGRICGSGFLKKVPAEAKPLSLKTIARYSPRVITQAMLDRISREFARLPVTK